MAKRRLSKMLEEMAEAMKEDVSFTLPMDDAVELMHAKLAADMFKKFGSDFWVNEDGQKILLKAAFIPEIVPKHYIGLVIKAALNKRYVYAFIQEIDKKVPVVIPPKWAKRMVKKKIKIEAITDVQGTTYRYVK